MKNDMSTQKTKAKGEKKPWFARLWARLKSKPAPKDVQKPIAPKKRKAKARVAMYPIMMGLAAFASTMVTGVVGSLGWYFAATMVKEFVATVATVFQPKFVGLAMAAACVLTSILAYGKAKRRIQAAARAEVTGVRARKSTGEYARYFNARHVLWGLALFAFLTGGALISILVFQGGKALWLDGSSILDKVLATKVVVITAIGSVLYAFALWYAQKRRQWAKEARRQAYAQRAAKTPKTGKDQLV